jgi:cell division protein ZapA (FtsZ GTPase activity inhibitor)
MAQINHPIGRKIFSIKCADQDAANIESLAKQLNSMVNANALKHRGLSDDNLLLITAIEILESLNFAKNASQNDLFTPVNNHDNEQQYNESLLQMKNNLSTLLHKITSIKDIIV